MSLQLFWCFVCANNIQQNIIQVISVGNRHFTYYKQRWGHDKAGDFFLIWATQLFWLSHQGNKGFIGVLVTTLLPGGQGSFQKIIYIPGSWKAVKPLRIKKWFVFWGSLYRYSQVKLSSSTFNYELSWAELSWDNINFSFFLYDPGPRISI